MILGKVFERFVQRSPVTVMVRGVLENVFAERSIDALFEATAERQYCGELLFSSVVDLLAQVVAGTRKSVRDAYQTDADKFEVSLRSVYNKLNGTEIAVSRALVRETAGRLGRLIRRLNATLPAPLPGYRCKIIDGNHLPATEHRLKELRTTKSGPLPGQALVVLEPELMLATDVFPCEDGHAQERSLLPEVLQTVEAGDAWVADRNFCTTDFLFGIAARKSHFVIRQHASTLTWEFIDRRRKMGRCDTGMLYAQSMRITHPDGREMIVRRITVKLDTPTRHGETEIHILTNLPKRVGAWMIAKAYRGRWRVENAFQELGQALRSEIKTLGYPPAALLGFCIGLLTYNTISVVKAALRSVHGEEAALEKISGYYLASEISATYQGMMIAIPAAQWTCAFADLHIPTLANLLKELAGHVRLDQFRKNVRGPKKPPPKRSSGKRQKHVSTARLLAQRKLVLK